MITCLSRPRQQVRPNSSVGRTSASSCSTWRAKRTTSSDPDPLDESISDLVRAAQEDLDGVPRVEVRGTRDRGELVERSDSISYILLASGYCARDFRVRVVRGELRIDAPDFRVTRPLRCTVDPLAVKTDYRNGVLSVSIPKKL